MMSSFPFNPRVLGALFGVQKVTDREEARPLQDRIGSGVYTILDWTALPVLRRTLLPLVSWTFTTAINSETAKNLQGKAQVWARKQALDQITANITGQADPVLSELLTILIQLRDKSPVIDEEAQPDGEGYYEPPTVTYTLEEKRRAVVALRSFLQNHKTLLENARHANGAVIRLEGAQQHALTGLLNKLNRINVDQNDICFELDNAITFLEPIVESQMGLLPRLRNLGQSMDVGKFLELLGLPKPDPERNLRVNQETEEAERALLRRVTEQTAEIAPPVKLFEEAVIEKLDEIADLAIKMTLVRLIFNGRSKAVFVKVFNEAMTKKSDDVSFDTAFLKALEDEFSTSNKDQSIVDRTRYWFHLKISLPFLKFYMGSMMGRFKVDLLMFLKRSPEERINDVFACALQPLKAHMAAFYSYNRKLAGETVSTSIDDTNRKYFDALQLDDSISMDSVLLQFSSFLVERYAPTISWTQGIQTSLDKLQAKAAVPFAKWGAVRAVLTATKVTMVGAAILTTGAFEWALNKGMKYLLRNELKKQIKINFFKGESSALTAHSRYQYFINRFITGKLRHFNANGATKDQTPRKLRSSPTTQQEMQQVIDELFRNIPLSIATRSAETLGKYFSSDAIEQGKRGAYSFFVDQFTPTVSLEILKGLEHFLYDDKEQGKTLGLLSEFVWYTTNNLTNVITTEATEAEQTEMIATETDMHEQLRMTVQSVVKEGVATALDPSKKHQDSTNAVFADIRRQAQEFSQFVEHQSDDDLAVFEKEWKRLNEAIFAMLKETKIDKIVHVRSELVIAFERATVALSRIIAEIMNHEKTRKQLQQHLEILNGLEGQIKAADGREKIAKLSILGEKTWVNPRLKECIGIYKQYLNDYLATRSNQSLVKQERDNAAQFELELQNEKQRLISLIKEQTDEIQFQLQQAQADKGKLDQWIAKLRPMTLTTEDVTSPLTRLIKTMNLQGVVQDGAVTAVVQAVRELINFKEKSYHWNQVLIRAMHASNKHVTR